MTPVELALAPALRLRLLGAGLVAEGLLVAAVVVLAWLADLPGAVVSAVLVVAAVGVLVLGLLLGVKHWVLRLDEHGYRVRGLRTPQARSARWTDVLDLQAGESRPSAASCCDCATGVRRCCRSTRSRAVRSASPRR